MKKDTEKNSLNATPSSASWMLYYTLSDTEYILELLKKSQCNMFLIEYTNLFGAFPSIRLFIQFL